jgi:hypothetical protein
MPFGADSLRLPRLRFLTHEQALADFAGATPGRTRPVVAGGGGGHRTPQLGAPLPRTSDFSWSI